MSVAKNRWMTFVLICLVSFPGCNYFQNAATDDDADIADIEDDDKVELASAPKAEIAKEALPAEAQLELKVRVGDQFPLSKMIEQRLTQTDKDGRSFSTSRTELVLSLTVDKIQPDGNKLMTVRYHRVKYAQDIRGKKIAYSSDQRGEPVPPEALVYSGLADNGFSFWVGPNNKVVELVGFNEFLKGCLRNVPPQYVANVRQQLEATKSSDGIANFIDDSIGLLPYSQDQSHHAVAVKEGAYWDLEPRMTEVPFPMVTMTRCVLKELSPQCAEILLSGEVSGPPQGVVIRSPEGDLKVTVKGGHSTGFCRVDRKSGLPTNSEVLRAVDFLMEFPDGQKILQNKETVSTITSYLNQNQFSAAPSSRRVQQTNFQNAVGTEGHRQVIQAGGANQTTDAADQWNK